MGEFEQVVLLAILRLPTTPMVWPSVRKSPPVPVVSRHPARFIPLSTGLRTKDWLPRAWAIQPRSVEDAQSAISFSMRRVSQPSRAPNNPTGGYLRVANSRDLLMHTVNIAERILALVTAPDRGASIVGDLTERAATRGMFWFWSGFLRTATSLLWRDVAEDLGGSQGWRSSVSPSTLASTWSLPDSVESRSSDSHGERTSTSFGFDWMEVLVRHAGAD